VEKPKDPGGLFGNAKGDDDDKRDDRDNFDDVDDLDDEDIQNDGMNVDKKDNQQQNQ
jgi:hypothetical protein